MARHVGVLHGVVEDVGTGLEEIVDRPRHVFLVARDRARAHDDRVAGLDLHKAVVAVGHARQTGHRFALGACGGDDDAVGRHRPYLVLAQDLAWCEGQVAQVGGDTEVLLHRTADDRDLPVEAGGGVAADFANVAEQLLLVVVEADLLLDAGDVAREGGDDDPAVEGLHYLPESLPDRPLGQGVARVLGARRVREEADDAVLAQS